MEDEDVAKPTTRPIIRGRIDKTCGPLQRYASRTLELHPNGGLYVYLDGMPDPKNFIPLKGAALTNNTDSPNGFAILPANGGKKQKFICDSLETKKKWIAALHAATTGKHSEADEALPNEDSRRLRGVLVREGSPLKEGNLMKRRGVGSSYNVRWFEVWARQGIAYAKYKSAADAAFKVVPIQGSAITMNVAKLRICIDPSNSEEAALYIRFESVEEMESWMMVFERERGSADSALWEDLGTGSPLSAGVLPPTATGGLGDGEDESDIEAELTDLESAVPVHHSSVPCVCEELSSINRTLKCDKDTPGFDTILEARLMQVGDYGFPALLKRFEERMTVPIYGPFSALTRHINNLDLEAKTIRHELIRLIDDYPRELRIVIVAREADQLLAACSHAREVYQVRKEIAEFRELKDVCGLKLGVNGTIAFIDSMCREQDPTKAHGHDIAKVQKLLGQFELALKQFRIDYDVFDDAYFTIDEMTVAAERTHQWLEKALAKDPHDDDDI